MTQTSIFVSSTGNFNIIACPPEDMNSPVTHDAVPAQYEPLLFHGGVPFALPAPTKSVRFLRLRNLTFKNDVVGIGNTVRRGTLLVERRSPISRVGLSDTWEVTSRHNSESAGRVARLHDHVPKQMCLIVLLIDAAACPFRLEARHLKGRVERSRVPSRNSASRLLLSV